LNACKKKDAIVILKDRLHQIEADKSRGHDTDFVMKGCYP